MNEFNLRQTVSVVTGGAGGIGRALAARLTEVGSRVAVVDVDLALAEHAAAELTGAIGLAADVGDPVAVATMVAQVEARLGPIDVYCSNAGIAAGDALGDDAAWELSWRTHVLAHIYAARQVLPGMEARRSGAMVARIAG